MELISDKEKKIKAIDIDIHKLLDLYELDKTKDITIFFHRLKQKTKLCL